MNRWVKGLAITATVVMFLVMIAGSLVTKTDSGMGCGSDWPLCNGKWVPEYTIESIIEYLHRVITGIAGLIVVAFSLTAWLKNRGNKEILSLALFGFMFIVVESLLGAAAVIAPQSAPVLALHFGFSLLAYTGVFLLTVTILQKDKSGSMIRQRVSGKFRLYVFGIAVFAYGVVYLGAFVRHTGAMLSCSSWPLCDDTGSLIPDLTAQGGLVGIHFAHRLAAAFFFLLVLGLLVYAVKNFKNVRNDLYYASIIAFVLVTAQVISGAFVVMSRLHLYATLSHSAIITMLFGTLAYICLQSLKGPKVVSSSKPSDLGVGS